MAFDLTDVIPLIILIAWKWFQPKAMSEKQRTWYRRKMVELFPEQSWVQIPDYVFPFVWKSLHIFDALSLFFFYKFTELNVAPVQVENWTKPAVFGVWMAVDCMSKSWGPIFFYYRWFGIALGVSLGMFFTQALYIAFLLVAQFQYTLLGYLWYVPFIFALPTMCWLFFANFLGYTWYAAATPNSSTSDYQEMKEK